MRAGIWTSGRLWIRRADRRLLTWVGMKPLTVCLVAVLALVAQAGATRTHLDDLFSAQGARVHNPGGEPALYTFAGQGGPLTLMLDSNALIPAGDTSTYPGGTAVGRVSRMTLIVNRPELSGRDLATVNRVLWKLATICFNISASRQGAFDAATRQIDQSSAARTSSLGPLNLAMRISVQQNGKLAVTYTLTRPGMPGTGSWRNYCSVKVS